MYKTDKGKVPFTIWLESIKDPITKRRIKLRVDRMIDGNFGDTRNLGDDLYELRLFFGPGYRIYYTIENDTLVILFSGGDKSSQEDDITKAKIYLKEYKGGNHDK
jgi:putative addiction module killer protein